MEALLFIYQHFLTDETCSAYRGKGHTNGESCGDFEICENCDTMGNCFKQPDFYTYQIQEFGYVKGEADMMNEIYQRGPIVCGM